MKGLSESMALVDARLKDIEASRELALASSRKIIRMTKNAIHAVHDGSDPQDILRSIEQELTSLIDALKDEPESLFSSYIADAMMEYAEAVLLTRVVEGCELPLPSDIGVTPQAWAMGMADCIGELRRVVLDSLMRGEFERAKILFSAMEELSYELLTLDVADAVLPIRRKQDVARGIVEKTRSDLVHAVVSSH